MTRTHKTYISVLAAGVATLAIASSAIAADYSSVNALVADQGAAATEPSGYSSPAAIVGDGGAKGTQADRSSVNAITGDRQPSRSDHPATAASIGQSSLSSIVGPEGASSPNAPSPSPVTTADRFDWSDAVIGAGVTLALALTTVLLLGTTRRRTRVEPSV